MSNPFDQFALPTAPAPAAPEPAPPAPAPAGPVMNPPPQQMGYGQQPVYGQQPQMGAPPAQQMAYGQQPPSPYGMQPPSPYGQQPPAAYQQPPAQPYGAPAEQSPFGAAVPKPSAAPDAGNPFGGAPPAPVPDTPQQDPSQPDMGNPFGAAPAEQQAPPVAAPEKQPPVAGGLADPWGAPAAGQPDPSQAPPQPYGAPNPYAASDQQQNPYGAPPPQQPPTDPNAPPANPYGAPPAQPPADPNAPPANPYGAPPAQPPTDLNANPYGTPPANPYGAPPQQPPTDPNAPPANPYGAVPQQPPVDPNMGALVPSQQQSNPYAQPPPQPYGAPPQPYGQPPNPYGQPNPYGAPPPQPPPAAVDPFSVFESKPAPAPVAPESQAMVPAAAAAAVGAPQAPPAAPQPGASDDDFWGSFSANSPAPAADDTAPGKSASEEKKGDGELPPGGEWYDAKIFTPTLGVMFFKPQELTDSLFLNTDKSIVDSLGERPVVAFIVEGSSARSAGVELGHVLLKVNGVDVKNPKDASRLIKEGPRPLPLLFYVPNTDVVIAEGEHMVKYDTRDTTAPNSAKEWKPKYVVIGGIIAQPWMMNMYRSKSEYDIAVIETQARRPVSVKVKQFSLQGARIQNDWQGPQMVKYKNKMQPWKYIVVLPVGRNPIKISSPNLSNLKPVHEGIRRVLIAQQKGRGSGRASGGRPTSGDRSYSNRPSQQQPHRY